jgi:hydrogenase maturation protein HypF
MSLSSLEGRRIHLRGTVQGVGMRPWIYRTACEHRISGTVWNEPGGVTIEAFGDVGALDTFLADLRTAPPPAAIIDAVESTEIPSRETDGFLIVESRASGDGRPSIPPELATCDACAREVLDPADRRYRYPFTNCTNCGPRFTIATGVPYDRPATTMGTFRMCPACQREYDDPADRRFHAQPNACPVCGPRLSVLDGQGRAMSVGDPLCFAAAQIAAGLIVAVKGLGGFHLACDATSNDAVARLRARKHRDEKPFAVMVGDLPAAERIVDLGAAARALLTSVERPIVIAPARAGTGIAPDVAPRNPMLGVMLPYTPLHHLLLADGGRPLVMTSANLSDEPIVYRNDEAVERLQGVADFILVHDREIVTRCDDSVATVIAGRPLLLRRSRGYVPRAIPLGVDVETPVLATGAHLKNTFCLAAGRYAWLGPHIGDLENDATCAAFEEAIERMERFLGFRGELIAHDLHPEYWSTRYAHERGGARLAVQHHHAHVASALAEHRLSGPVIGVAFDGTGLGTDGTAWGGEFLVAAGATYERVATFRPVALPGGDLAIRQPWRIALAALMDAFGRRAPVDAFPLFQAVRSPATCSWCGRWLT